MTDVTLTVTVPAEKAAEILSVLRGPGSVAVETDEEESNSSPRIYGKPTPGLGARRTKAEMAEDKAIAERWATLWPSKPTPPAKPIAELLEHLEKVEQKADDDGFSVEDDDDGENSEEPLTLEEFRVVLVAHSKTLGAELSEIMAPYKNPAQVPEEERRSYADAIIKAVESRGDA